MGRWTRESKRPPEGGISTLYRAHSPSLLAWLQSRTYSAQTAADICAETFAVALESYDKFDPSRGTADAWLFGIARNLLRRYQRNAVVDFRARQRLALQSVTVTEDDLDFIETRYDSAALARQVHAAVDDLSPKLALAVRSRVLDEEPYSVVAERCGCSEQAARVRVCRALSILLDRAQDLGLEGMTSEIN